MSTAIEETLKALTEFESRLDGAKAEASEARRQMLKMAAEWAEAARGAAVAEAQKIASEAVAKAKKEAEKEAESIAKKGQVAVKHFEASLSKQKSKAAELVTKTLLGEGS
jgi:vacuolar-type H+-ATPase subunit H